MNKENQNKTSLLFPATVNGSLIEFIQKQQHKVSFTRLCNNSRGMRVTSKAKKTKQPKTPKTQQNQNQLTDRKILQWINVTDSSILISCISVFSLSTKQLGFSRSVMVLPFSKILRCEILTLQRVYLRVQNKASFTQSWFLYHILTHSHLHSIIFITGFYQILTAVIQTSLHDWLVT